MIENIQFIKPSGCFDQYVFVDRELKMLKPLSKINFFVGPNNSGKSRFLRGLVSDLYQYGYLNEDKKSVFLEDIENIALFSIGQTDASNKIIESLKRLRNILIDNDIFDQLIENISTKQVLNEYDLITVFKQIKTTVNNITAVGQWDISATIAARNEKLKAEAAEISIYIESLLPLNAKERFKITYVPISRTLRKTYDFKGGKDSRSWESIIFENLKSIDNSPLQLRTLLDYFTKNGEEKTPTGQPIYEKTISSESIFTGENFYDLIRELRTGKENKRKILTGFEDFLSGSFFNNQPVEINGIEDEKGKEVHIKIGHDNEFPIYSLGDGIQAIILLTFPLFYYRDDKNHVIFYEEPELYLHPGMQRIFIETIRQFYNTQVFIATHSTHLLDTSIDFINEISIFSLERTSTTSVEKFKVENLTEPGMSLLNSLGIRNSSVFLSNCTIWIEGISDRLYIRKYLELYMEQFTNRARKFKEDLHYSFLEFGGNNIVHYDFSDCVNNSLSIKARKITNKIFLIHDADQRKDNRHQLLYSQLGEAYKKLPVLEIENLLTADILKKTLSDFRKFNDQALLFNDLKQLEIGKLPFFEVIERMIKTGEIKKIVSKKTLTSTSRLYDKALFARTATSHMKNWKDLSPHAQKLTKDVYDFISNHNPK